MADPHFITCSLRCLNCGVTLATTDTMATRIPRRRLYMTARMLGALHNERGWFCGPYCRTVDQMAHAAPKRDMPKCD